MPELPEVETVSRALRLGGRGGESILGREVAGGELLWGRTLAEPLPEMFFARIQGQQITGVGRRGKFLIIHLSQDTLLIHLRMSGDIRIEAELDDKGQPVPLQLHDRLVLHFMDGMRLAFNDVRKFGRVWLVDNPEQVLAKLGPDPFEPDFTAQAFYERLQQHNRQIKPLLLDQTFIAGLGNIYTDEALHVAGIHPLRSSARISREEAERLWTGIRAVLSEGIRRNGASIDWVYRGGDFQNSFQVYQRTGEPCQTCGTPIVRITVGQRSTHFCPTCQLLNR